MTKDTGGPAFPIFPETGGGHAAAHQGLTMRDYFAAKAMQSLISVWEPNDCAVDAYAYADAMLEARK